MGRLKRSLPAVAISSLFIIVFNVIAFVLAVDLNKNFWCGYIFITLSWLCLVVVEIMGVAKDDGGKSLFLNVPGILVSVVHLVVQTLFGVLVMAIPAFSIKIAICLEVLIMAIYLGIIGILEVYKSKSKR